MATAAFSLSCTVSGLPEQSTGTSSLGFSLSFATTQTVWEWRTTSVTTVAANMPTINLPSSASFLVLIPIDSTNTWPYRLQASTSTALSGVGITLSSLGPSCIAVNPAATSQYFLWSTANASTVNVRVGIA